MIYINFYSHSSLVAYQDLAVVHTHLQLEYVEQSRGYLNAEKQLGLCIQLLAQQQKKDAISG